MHTIFFDLETSDLNPIGQILNFAFVEYDSNWNIKSSYSDKIKISRLQLPSPDAIAVNRIDVIEHNSAALDFEHIAMSKIQRYIHSITEHEDAILVGYNSQKFDVPFLRTSMIRNGINPYFGGGIKYGDLLHVVQKLSIVNPEFRNLLLKSSDNRIRYSLESVCKALGLLQSDEQQMHDSLHDAHLTAKLAKHILDNFGLDVRTYRAYEPSQPSISKYDVVKIYPYKDDLKTQIPDEFCYFAPLEQNKTQALWINLKQFEDGLEKKSVSWYNKNSSRFFVSEFIEDPSWKIKADYAKTALSHINLKNFWPERTCDIEQFIFMMPIEDIGALYDAIWRRDLFLLKTRPSKYASKLYLRYLCNTADIDQVEHQIEQYVLYRYGGRLKLDKNDSEQQSGDAAPISKFHPTYIQLTNRIQELMQNDLHRSIMKSLQQLYSSSFVSSFFV